MNARVPLDTCELNGDYINNYSGVRVNNAFETYLTIQDMLTKNFEKYWIKPK